MLKIFVAVFVVALVVLAYRLLVRSEDRIDLAALVTGKAHAAVPVTATVANPLRSNVFVAILATDARWAAQRICQIFDSAASSATVVVGAIQRIHTNTEGNIAHELRRLDRSDLVPRVRVSLTKEANDVLGWRTALDELHDNEAFVVLLDRGITLPNMWDYRSIQLFETTNPNLVFSASMRGDFPVCAGAHHGIPHFEARHLAFRHDHDVAYPTSAVFTDYIVGRQATIKALFPAVPAPLWTLPAILASRAHSTGVELVGVHDFGVERSAEDVDRPVKERFERAVVLAEITDAWLETLGWDFTQGQPSGRARLGLSLDATHLEERLKWGTDNDVYHATNLVTGVFAP